MNKALSILCLLLLLIPYAAAAAEQQYCTIGQLHEMIADDYPNGWQESIETKWRTVEINAPVLVPDTYKIPIIFLRLEENDVIDVSSLLGDGWESDSGKRISASRTSDPSEPDFSEMKIESNHYYTPVNLDMKLENYGGKTLHDVAQEVWDVLECVNQGTAGFDMDHPFDVMVNIAIDPKTGKSQECWVNYLAYQTVSGIPLFRHIGYYLPYDLPVWKDRIPWINLNMGMSPYNGMRFGYYPTQTKTVEEDVPLASFSKVQKTLRKEIEAGYIRKILEMRLGYTVVDVKDDPEGYTGATRPIWHVEVWWCKNGKAEIKGDDLDYPTNDHGKLECARLAIDAQTGKIIGIAGTYAPKKNILHGIEDFQGYVSWEDTQGT